jgi:nucleotide-binding universal stress UspA family protein
MITLKRILVPHDFSETSEAAMKYATELARIFGAKLHVLHVSETDRTDMPTEFALGLEEGMEDARERLLKTVTGHDKREFNPNFELRCGTPPTEIARYAKERDIDLIVMGTHGRGFTAHAVVSSVTEKVVRNAPCPVLTLPWWSFALGVASPRASELFPASIQPLAYV